MNAGDLIVKERRDTDSHKWSRYADRDIIPAWVADTDYEVAQPILTALHARVQHGVFGYADGSEALRNTIVDYFKNRWQWNIKPEWLVWTPGLGCAIHNVCRMACGGEVITPAPIYHVFRAAPTIANATRVDVVMRCDENNKSGSWQLDINELAAAITPNTRVLQLCNPHNPNGKVFSRGELEAIGELCCKHDLIICADEVHADIILDEDKPHIPIASLNSDIAKRTITLQSPSKAFNIAGLNFAVAVISDENLRQQYIHHSKGKVLGHLNPFAYTAAQAAWGDDASMAWLAAMTTRLRSNRNALAAAVESMDSIHMPHLCATYLAWLNISELNLESPQEHFEAHGIGMSEGEVFGDKDYMRLNFGCSPSLLQSMIERLQAATTLKN